MNYYRYETKLMASKPPPPQQSFNLLPKIINGGIAGIVGVSIMFPMDLVKTRLQNQPIGPNGEKQYKNIFDCFMQTYRKEGYFGMYRGSSVNILLITPEKAIKLAANDYYRWMLQLKDGTLPIFRQALAGGMAGACQIVITTPMELLKIQLQDSGRLEEQAKKEGRKFVRPTAMSLTRQLLAERGIFGLYKGIGATAFRDISFSVVYFPLFAELNKLGADENGHAPFQWSFLSGLCAACFSSWIVTPLDCVKTRLQAAPPGTYSSWLDCFRKTLLEGPSALFRGAFCRVLVVGPLFGIAQAVYYVGIAEWLLGYNKGKNV